MNTQGGYFHGAFTPNFCQGYCQCGSSTCSNMAYGSSSAVSIENGDAPGRTTYSAQEWSQYNQTEEGNRQYRWWADWIPTPDGQAWCNRKHYEARCVVNGMIAQWGLDVLREGHGVIDVGGDPGFVAAELLRSGIPVTVVDPAFGAAGKTNAATLEYINAADHWRRVPHGSTPLQIVRKPFDKDFAADPSNAALLHGASAIIALYPDEATDFLLYFTAQRSMRTAIIPCNECAQYYPPHDPTYEGFVNELLRRDRQYVGQFGHNSILQREFMSDTPFCRVVLQRTPQRWPLQPSAPLHPLENGPEAMQSSDCPEHEYETHRRTPPSLRDRSGATQGIVVRPRCR